MKTNDEKLVQQMRTVFEDYDDGLGEQGWAELRKKYPEKENKKLPIWWLTGIAASLLLVVGLYFSNAFDTEKVILRAGTTQKENTSIENINRNKEKNTSITELDVVTPKTYSLSKNRNNQSDKPQEVVNKITQYIAQANSANNSNYTKEANGFVSNPNTDQTKPLTPIEHNNPVIAAAVKPDEKAIANAVTTENNTEITENSPKQKLSTEDFLKEQSKLLANNDTKDVKKTSTSKTTLDVFTGTFLSYHDDHEAKISAGVGLNANVKVAKNLIFSFGAGISQNKVSYENKVPTEISQAMFASKDNGLSFNAPSSDAYSVTATNDVSFNGRLLSIDLPMVVKFFPSKKQDFYISTGVNSSTYLSQEYTYNYSRSNFNYRNGEAQTLQETQKSSLTGFDFANSAIIAIGINQNIGKNILIFEPYYRPALNTMGDKNLRISSAGLNLKFNFNGANK